MTVILEIRDIAPGDGYWWRSPDIWFVPGSNPLGTPGIPSIGNSAYLWARVHNRGDDSINGIQVNFYSATLAPFFYRSKSNFIGKAFVDLKPHEAKDVLCLTPWIRGEMSATTECIFAEALHPIDPLPNPLSDNFRHVHHHQVAAVLLQVIQVRGSDPIMVPIHIPAPRRIETNIKIGIKNGSMLSEEKIPQLGIQNFKLVEAPIDNASLVWEYGNDFKNDREKNVKIKDGQFKQLYLRLNPHHLDEDSYALLDIVSTIEDVVVGGITFILVP